MLRKHVSNGGTQQINSSFQVDLPLNPSQWRDATKTVPKFILHDSQNCWKDEESSGHEVMGIYPHPEDPWDWYICLHLVDSYAKYSIWATKKKKTITFRYTGCLIGILDPCNGLL